MDHYIIDEINKNLNITDFEFLVGGANSLYENKQLEIFFNVLKEIKSDFPKMIESGSREAYYSILFNIFFKDIQKLNICVEFDKDTIETGIRNSNKNKCNNIFFECGYVGKPFLNQFLSSNISNLSISLENLFLKYNIEKLDILHTDIQGSEIFVLDEIVLKKLPIKWFFINIHDDPGTKDYFGRGIYESCKNALDSIGVTYLFDNRTLGGYGDGLIIACTN